MDPITDTPDNLYIRIETLPHAIPSIDRILYWYPILLPCVSFYDSHTELTPSTTRTPHYSTP